MAAWRAGARSAAPPIACARACARWPRRSRPPRPFCRPGSVTAPTGRRRGRERHRACGRLPPPRRVAAAPTHVCVRRPRRRRPVRGRVRHPALAVLGPPRLDRRRVRRDPRLAGEHARARHRARGPRARQRGGGRGRAARAAGPARSRGQGPPDPPGAGLDRGRTAELLERKLVARQDFDHADNAFKTAGSALEAARQRLDVAHAEVAQAEAEVATQEVVLAQSRRQREEAEHTLGDARSRRGEVTVRSAEEASAEAQLAEARAALREAELNLEYTTIAAPVSGRVTRRTVEVGQTVQPGQPLLAVVDVANVWVIANYKETQLTHVRPGQLAPISVDTHPGLVLRARVDSIQSGTGSRFSLLPPENASGNFVKVVQRIPVKLVLEPGQRGQTLLVPGMSVVPVIQLR